MSDEDVFFHFPPPPTEEPSHRRLLYFGPPRSPEKKRKNQPLTDSEVADLPVAELIERIMNSDQLCLIFGITKFDTITEERLKERFKNLSRRVHPDKTRDKNAGAAFDRVKTALGQVRDCQLNK